MAFGGVSACFPAVPQVLVGLCTQLEKQIEGEYTPTAAPAVSPPAAAAFDLASLFVNTRAELIANEQARKQTVMNKELNGPSQVCATIFGYAFRSTGLFRPVFNGKPGP